MMKIRDMQKQISINTVKTNNLIENYWGRFKMKSEKKATTLAAIILLLIGVVAVMPTVNAGEFHIVKGTLYVDEVVMGEGAQIKVNILTDTFYFDTFDPDVNGYTYYLGAFQNDIYYGATAYFTVSYNGGWYTPIDNASVALYENTNPAVENYILDMHVDTSVPANNPPNAPTLVAPADGSTIGTTTSATPQVNVVDPDGNTMDVLFYNADGDILIGTASSVASGSSPSATWSGLTASTTYSWYATANDGEFTVQSATWSFTTGSGSSGGGGEPPSGGGGGGGDTGGGGYIPPATPSPPVADAGGPYGELYDHQLGYAEVDFDGSDSTGTSITFLWDFGDSTTSTEQNPTHRYYSMNNFTVTLTVSNSLGDNASTTWALITPKPNLPPTAPIVTGTQTGSDDTDYEYTAVSADPDGDTIKYIFNWGDETSTTTEFYDNNTQANVTHNWSDAGAYTVTVTANDNATDSDSTSIVVLIDAMWVQTIGNMMDTDGDGDYDTFYSNETGEVTDVELQDDGTYYIDSDGEEGWDWVYDPVTDTLTEYSAGGVKGEDNILWYIGAILVIIIILGLILLAGRRKGKKQEPQKPKKGQNSKKK